MLFSWRGKESATLRRLVVSELTEQHGKCSSCGDDCGSASGCRGRSRKVAVGGYKYRHRCRCKYNCIYRYRDRTSYNYRCRYNTRTSNYMELALDTNTCIYTCTHSGSSIPRPLLDSPESLRKNLASDEGRPLSVLPNRPTQLGSVPGAKGLED